MLVGFRPMWWQCEHACAYPQPLRLKRRGVQGPAPTSVGGSGIVAMAAGDGDADFETGGPRQAELAVYVALKRGLVCGVHDPDFAEPLDGRLHLERGLRLSMRLECEDESLSFSKGLHHLRVEPRDMVQGGRGLALVVDGAPGDEAATIGIVVADSIEERDTLQRVLQRMRENPRVYRRRKRRALLQCMPVCGAGRVSVPCGRPRRQPHSPKSGPASILREMSFSSTVGGLVGARRSAAQEERPSFPGMDEVMRLAKEEWDKVAAMQAAGRRSSLAGRFSAASRTPRSSGAGATASSSREGLAAMAPSKSVKAGRLLLEPSACGTVLARLLDRGASFSAPEDWPDDGNWKRQLGDLFQHTRGGKEMPFEDFRSSLEALLFVDRLWVEPVLKKHLNEEGSLPGMSLEKLRWFLVQVQCEARDVVEAAEPLLAGLGAPDVDPRGRMTMFGLSRYLCSTSNSILSPSRCRLNQDMTRPMTDYWISAAHHVHADALRQPLRSALMSPEGFGTSDNGAEQRSSIHMALEAGCRCLGLALGAAGPLLQVVFQEERMLLDEALQMVAQLAFRKTSFPLLLVLHLGMLPAASCGLVPGALVEAFGQQLWRAGAGAALPSPEEAKGRVVVVLAPAAPGFDPALEAEPPPALKAAPQQRGPVDDDRLEAVAAWEEASRRFACWQGRPLDGRFPQQLPSERAAHFVPCDELRALERRKPQQMTEYHRQYLTIAFPVAPRKAPANFNPGAAWACGVQAAALSLSSGCGDGAVLAHCGRFAQDNGGCGYVLKPPHLRSGAAPDDGPAVGGLRLDLRILAARALPRLAPEAPVAVAVSVWGATRDCARQSYAPMRLVGGVVDWPEARPSEDGTLPKPMSFAIASPSAAVLLVELLTLTSSSQGGGGGYRRLCFFAAPVDGLRPGLRWVPLWIGGCGGEVRPTRCGPLSGLLAHATMRPEVLAGIVPE